MSSRRTLGPAIRAIREARGLTLDKVCADVEITRSYLARIERGHKQPSDPLADRLAKRLLVDRAAFTYMVCDACAADLDQQDDVADPDTVPAPA